MQINLNIDQILQHVVPWKFSVTVGGKTYATRRPSIGDLGAMMNVEGKSLSELTDLLDSLFTQKPDIHWELPVAIAFIEGYLEYFNRHSGKNSPGAGDDKKKDPAAVGTAAAAKAREMVAMQWSGLAESSGA